MSLTANQITLVLIPVTIVAVSLYVRYCVAKAARKGKSHGPHTPGAGYDAKEMAVSKGKGMADGGIG